MTIHVHTRPMIHVPLCPLLIVCLWVAGAGPGVAGESLADAESLMHDLFNASTYYPELRPVLNQSRPIYVDVGVYLISLGDLDEVGGTISVVVVLGLFWTDDKMVWDPSKYGGLYQLILPKRRLWTPDLYLVNPADDIVAVGSKYLKASVYYNGFVFLGTGSMLKASCAPDMTSFPFDEQTCALRLMPWGYEESSVTLVVTEPEADLSRYTDNGEWALKQARSHVSSFSGISELHFTLGLKRKPLYFVLSIILPIASLCLMNPIVFCLPVECGERVSYSITLSLSFAVFLTMTSDIIPQSSEPMPILIYFLFAAQSFSGTIAVVNAMILVVYFHPPERPIPQRYLVWMRLYLWLTCRGSRGTPARVTPEVKDEDIFTTDKLQGVDTLKLQDIDDKDDNSSRPQTAWGVHHHKVTWKHIGRSLDVVAYVITNLTSIIGALTFILTIAL